MNQQHENNPFMKGYIYGIYCKTTKKLYIGSSISPMKKRLSDHISDMKGAMGLLNCKRNYRTSSEVLIGENYIHWKIEDFPCETKKELHYRETLWIIKGRKECQCVNRNLPVFIPKKDQSLLDLSVLSLSFSFLEDLS